MKKYIKIALLISVISSCQNLTQKKFNFDEANELEKVSYSIGINVATSIKSEGLDSINSFYISKGFKDVFENKDLAVNIEESNKIIGEYFNKKQDAKNERLAIDSKIFLEQNKQKDGVITTESGLQYLILSEGKGNNPTLNDNVTVHYHGTLIDGTIFDSSVDRKQPATFPLNGVIPGWQEALQMMSVGSKWKIFIPSELAYAESGAGAIGPNSTLIFEVELLSIN
ncbi:MAG: FKBP-type peptidyl-prolyl cis-trans isomerase [Flavobacteriales bacterium TMED84]|nr:MAG: FKBP-type peptidyl-prolyl cis-trans isomerase [Flavobacteriales bacterium TMED84]|tara:strand:+ start:2354 stop:3031 length:678 start_codon:yes stop_codon:yes gene_type:complete